mmetsp:Transcript_3386/g.4165  ORF Transcript_3386/g.4165 Transcript_3386/m.4165 type:complete len:166 (-) Transcript_3386:151-648(-)
MLMLNKRHPGLFDFTKSTESSDSVYHLSAKLDHYHIVEVFAQTPADIFAVNADGQTAKEASCRTLVILATLIKIERKTLRNDLVRRKTEFMQKYAKDSKGKHKGKGLQINQGNAPFFKYGPGFVHFFIIGSQGMKKTQDGTRTAKRITSYTQVMKKWMDLSTSRK